MRLNSKICLITGASKGIGRATVERFCKEGATVYANGRNEGSLDEWADSLTNEGPGKVVPAYFDVTDEISVKSCIQRIRKEQGRLDVLVNNAGILKDAPIGMISHAMTEEVFTTNVFAVINLIQYACKLMVRQKSGSIINMASIMGVVGNKNQVVYAGSKGAIVAVTKSAAKELAPFNIRVNAIAPGIIDTDMFHQIGDEFAKELVDRVGMHRVGSADDVSKLCLFLASDDSLYISGQIIGVDGAMVV
ncbi:SDR family NAD(P)-dependent oxidoreductase [Raoultibacter phocaeensis]|uniref:SDR family NAD(P)-dependent oxidoreductase n=1 Tax=Raoultibacter phocaeensis TaxID=2479841 RepID=UPI001119B352|nr:SDR family NAD(P)-dependent oxidoreductase [Raoultibacter phocaeensis]